MSGQAGHATRRDFYPGMRSLPGYGSLGMNAVDTSLRWYDIGKNDLEILKLDSRLRGNDSVWDGESAQVF